MTSPVEVRQQAGAKIQVLDLPVALPHKCASCGISHNEDGRVFFDFRIHIDFYGTIYLCSECIVPLMNSVGWISPEQRQALDREQEELKRSNLELRGKVVSYGNALRNFIDSDQLDMVGLGSDSSEATTKDDSKSKSANSKQRSNDVSDATGSVESLIGL